MCLRQALTWEDRIFSLWLAFGLLTCALLFSLVPWGAVLHWGTRALGFLFFGPHMYFVGQAYKRRRKEASMMDHEYRMADESTKHAIIQAKRAQLVATHEARLVAVREHQSRRAAERAHYLREARYVVAVRPDRTSARIKYNALPCPYRSTARARVHNGSALALNSVQNQSGRQGAEGQRHGVV